MNTTMNCANTTTGEPTNGRVGYREAVWFEWTKFRTLRSSVVLASVLGLGLPRPLRRRGSPPRQATSQRDRARERRSPDRRRTDAYLRAHAHWRGQVLGRERLG